MIFFNFWAKFFWVSGKEIKAQFSKQQYSCPDEIIMDFFQSKIYN